MLRASAQSHTPTKAYTPIRMPMAQRMTMLTSLFALSLRHLRAETRLVGQRSGQSPFYGPSVPQSFIDGGVFQARDLRPLDLRFGDTVKHQQLIGSRISRLLFRGCPSTITRLVVALAINAVERVRAAWLAAHVGKETLERMQPSVADRDSAPAIVVVIARLRAQAARSDRRPRFVLRTMRHPVRAWHVTNFIKVWA